MTDYAPVSYWYPDLGEVDSRWQSVLDTRPPFALVNPNSGPGRNVDGNYLDLSGRLSQKGIKSIGYVSTRWGARPVSEIMDEIATYRSWYGIDGVFFDEAPNFWSTNQAGHIAKYSELRDRLRSLYGADFFIIHNPGTVPIEALIPLADVHMSFESSASNYLTNADFFPAWLKKHAPKMWHVVFGVTTENVDAVMQKAGGWASHIYLTDRVHDPNNVDGNNAPSTPDNNPYLVPPASWLLARQTQEVPPMSQRLIPGPVLGQLGGKTTAYQITSVDVAGFKSRGLIREFDVPAGKTLMIIAFGRHEGNPWQSPSLSLAGVNEEAGQRPGFPNFDTGAVKAGVPWRYGTAVEGPQKFRLTVGNTSPYDDEANRARFVGTVMWALVDAIKKV